MAENATQATATFRVHGSFVLRPRALFVLRGIVSAGAVAIGQRVVRPEGIDATVTGVEAGLANVGGGASQTGLTFRYTSPAQLAQWQALAPAGVELTLSGASAPTKQFGR